jgi:CBS domain-containing protein
VLAEGRGPETPVREAMSSPLRTLPASASLLEALLFLLEHGIHHAPVEEAGRIVGLITDTDLVRLQAKSPLHLLGAVRRIADERDLAGYARELAGVVEALFWAGVEAETIGRVVARLNDALLGRLLFLAEGALGPPPTPYAWIVHGSEGRMEQTLLSDQDNALVYRDDTPEAAAWCGALAGRVVGGLLAAGIPRCAGGYMATNWHRPLAGWEALFRSWIGTPDPQAMLSAANFFDFRAVHGDLPLDPLEDLLRLAGREKLFLAHLAKAAVGQGAPLGLLRHIREEEGGVDLKKGGLLPIVSLARLYGWRPARRPAPRSTGWRPRPGRGA